MTEPRIFLLGPQFHQPTVQDVVRGAGITGPVATITAGWQEWESEDQALRRQLGGSAVPLRLYARAERVWAADTELRDAHAAMQADLKVLRDLYNRQLEPAAEAWMDLLEVDGPERLVGPERDAALGVIQGLDARHLDRIAEIQADFVARMDPLSRPAVARERAELDERLASAAAVVVKGGHVAVLRNRMALFGVQDLLADKVLIGCAAGAMVLCRRVALYNDSPAIGRGHAEVALPGFDLAPEVVVLSDASRRLRLDDPARMARLALRLLPDTCVLLDPGARLEWDGSRWHGTSSRRIESDGSLADWEDAA